MSDAVMYPPVEEPWALEPHYCRHVAAMTAEGLHSKADIAAQLALRDTVIVELVAALTALNEAVGEAVCSADCGIPAEYQGDGGGHVAGCLQPQVSAALASAAAVLGK